MILIATFVGGIKDKVLAFVNLENKTVNFWDNITESISFAGMTKTPFGYAIAGEADYQTPMIILLNEQFEIIQEYYPKCIKAPHDVIWNKDHLIVASTGNNSLVKLGIKYNEIYEERYLYRHTTEAVDMYHLNSVAVNKDDFIYFSVFGRREQAGKWGLMKDGSILELWQKDNGELNIDDIGKCFNESYFHPHSLTMINNDLHFCESHNWTFRKYIDPLFTIKLDGYTRGISHDERNYYVGVSASRNISKSTGEPNEDVIKDVRCGIWTIPKNGDKMEKLDLSEYGVKEIYEILVFDRTRRG